MVRGILVGGLRGCPTRAAELEHTGVVYRGGIRGDTGVVFVGIQGWYSWGYRGGIPRYSSVYRCGIRGDTGVVFQGIQGWGYRCGIRGDTGVVFQGIPRYTGVVFLGIQGGISVQIYVSVS